MAVEMFWNAMEMKASLITTILLLLLLLVGPGFSRGTLRVKNMESEIYEIDYRGPETHTYIPPPDRAGDRPRIHHQTSMARRHKSKRHGKKTVG
ncbi:hypothetical protein PHJA_001059100 [Phtheirospermum japonicum]|uniref:Uncharacterized protein n=1 Tax=Phtheirospermum japonicum TaxID=374723 RepID=A0A830BXY4_9LAMI|nr:hypothetical protein PHJA_001059100 [Phtheirospermum japonicum]